jgi:Asp/Glu/hydantoin racemase
LRILIANPNTTRTMTDLMVAEARDTASPGTAIEGVTAEFGVPYIATRSEMAIAGHALLDLLARRHAGFDAIVVGAFCQPLVAPAKELMPVPVLGLTEAAMRAAQLLGRRIGVIGMGAADRDTHGDIVREFGLEAHMVGLRILPLSGTELAADQAAADAAVAALGERAVAEDDADVLVLGGAAFSGMARRIAARLPVPVVSPVSHAVGFAETIVRAGWRKPSIGTYAAVGAKSTQGVSAQLAAFFADPAKSRQG